MAIPAGWDASVAVAKLPVAPWIGSTWRSHRISYGATDWGGSLRVSDRYHRAPDRFPPDQTWPALYLALSYGVCMGETMRHLPTDAPISMLGHFCLSEIEVALRAVIDCRDVSILGISPDNLLRDFDYDAGQELAAAVRARGCDGLLISSATLLPDAALIVFPDMIQSDSLRIIRSIAPRLQRVQS